MTAYGCWLDLPSPFVAEIIGLLGFDFTVIDLEHGPMSLETAALCLMALRGAQTLPILRVAEGTEGQIKRALDAGARGIMVPCVESAKQAEAMVQYFRYPPRGRRGSAQSVIRAADYGLSASEYTQAFPRSHLLAVQIESTNGLAARAEIAATDGINMLFFGPADYAASLGVSIDSPEVFDAAIAVAETAQAQGLLAGTVLWPGTTSAALSAAGMTHISVTGDVAALTGGFAAALTAARREA